MGGAITEKAAFVERYKIKTLCEARALYKKKVKDIILPDNTIPELENSS